MKIIFKVTVLMSLLFMMNCGGTQVQVAEDPFTEVENEFEAAKGLILAAGGVADVGIGRSPRRDIAKEKARTNGVKNLASIFETQVQNLAKKFQEEVGEGSDVEINEMFSSATKTVIKKTLNFAIPKKTKYVSEKEDGKTLYSCYVLMAIEPGTVNGSLMDELKNKNQKTYERFRASKAFEDLDAEMKEYEANEN